MALPGLAGQTVRVGGIVGDPTADGFTLDDGTAVGIVVLRGAAADLLSLIEPGDANPDINPESRYTVEHR